MTNQPTPCYAIFGPNQVENPGKYVVRRFLIEDGIEPIPDYVPLAVVDSLDAARAAVPSALVRFAPDPADDVSLIESYL